MKKAYLWRMTGLEAAALLLGLAALSLLMYLCPEPADLRACVWAAPLLMGGGGGFYLGGKTSPRWFRAAVIAAVAGLALIAACWRRQNRGCSRRGPCCGRERSSSERPFWARSSGRAGGRPAACRLMSVPHQKHLI